MASLKVQILTFLTMAISSSLLAQRHTVSGYIRDAESGENLIGATVMEVATGKGTVANNYGFFSLSFDRDSTSATFSYVGYEALRITLKSLRDTTVVVRMKSASVLEEVVISGDKAEKIQETTRMGTVTIPIDQIRRTPTFMGETDPIKVLQLLPGVQAGTEGSSGLYVRGGGPDQNLFLLDGVAVYNPNHLFGFFSAFNADAVNHIELIKGGFPARYGGRLSSIVDISMKEGNMKEFHGQGSIGLIASKFSLEGPIVKDRTSFIISARRSYPDPLKSKYLPRQSEQVSDNYSFYDLNLKINHKINRKNRIYLSGYAGEDRAGTSSALHFLDSVTLNSGNSIFETSQKWGNVVGAVRWNHEVSKNLFCNTSISFSKYELTNRNYTKATNVFAALDSISEYYVDFQYSSGIRDISVKIDFDYIPKPEHYIKFGAEAIDHEFTPGVLAQTSTDEFNTRNISASRVGASELAMYVEDDWRLSEKWKANIGLRSSAFLVEGKTFYSAQPRLAARYKLSSETSFKASISTMQQCVQLLANSGLGLPTDLWVPATARVKPQTSLQVAVGAARLYRGEYEISAEAFYKTMKNVIEYKDGASYLSVQEDWQNKVEAGQGVSYGTELFVQKKVGKASGWLGYTLSWTNRQFENINDGKWFPYRYDRRHDVKIVGMYQINGHFDVAAVWIFGTGNALTVPLDWYPSTIYQNVLFVVEAYENRNGFRVRNYHRLDINASYGFKLGKTTNQITFSVFNTYGRNNTYYLDIVDTYNLRRAVLHKTLFGAMPSLSLSIKI